MDELTEILYWYQYNKTGDEDLKSVGSGEEKNNLIFFLKWYIPIVFYQYMYVK